MQVNPKAGKLADASDLVNLPKLITAYFTERPDPAIQEQRVAFGTSGHRGSAFRCSFNEDHILAISQAICEYRKQQKVEGPLFIGKDTHALSECGFVTALEVLAANGVDVMVDVAGGYTPTPVISHAILSFNQARPAGLADGIVITPSHNPPEDGGFKYDPPHGGPADTGVTQWIEQRANRLLEDNLREVRRVPYSRARSAATTHLHDYVGAYVQDLEAVVDLAAIQGAGVKIGADPLGGASVGYWGPIRDRYHLNLTVVNELVDPTFRFMTIDWDGKIRMDCSSPFAMASLIARKGSFDVAFANDTDADRHGIVTREGGLMNPNHYLAVAIDYLFPNRQGWSASAAVGKTVVSSSMIDRVAQRLGRKLVEVPVGFKWFVEGLLSGELGFGGEESAGASFLRSDGRVWTTDKDGLIMGLLAAEIIAKTGRDPAEHYRALTKEFGEMVYERTDTPATPEEKAALGKLSPLQVRDVEVAGEKILAKLADAPGNGAAIGGIKIVTEHGWFAARPSGTEDVYKFYAESMNGIEHLRRIQEEGRALIARALSTPAAN
ncbi:MAG TPA: phosphoglucomutase (alpha-D-glucose-1,6-bisphosphate-dependent) [Terriglobia bacterium]|nr:phosphoglucomutase (alpha-D-glucose-1,6-bisphosphate-dependent) [Terriglobia bacterium]